MHARRAARLALIAIAVLAYVLGSHWLMIRADGSPWDVVALLSPMLVVVGLGAWQGGQRWVSAVAGLAIGALCAQALMGVHVSLRALYLCQHVGINLFLALVFGGSLRAGRTPLITALATRVHGDLPPARQLYTRRLTGVWVLLFVGLVLGSVALFAFASFEAWAVFANLLTPLAVAGLFGGEYLIRYRLHPEFERSSVLDAVRAYMAGQHEVRKAP